MSTSLTSQSWFENTNKIWSRSAPVFVVLVMWVACCLAQTPAREPSASISGRVTVGGKGAAGITVVAAMRSSVFDDKTVAKTATDHN
jgi:hypothetical protein